jgi:hypothetical protein
VEPRKGPNEQSRKVGLGYRKKEEPEKPRGGDGGREGAVATAEGETKSRERAPRGAKEPTARRVGRVEEGQGPGGEGQAPKRCYNQTCCQAEKTTENKTWNTDHTNHKIQGNKRGTIRRICTDACLYVLPVWGRIEMNSVLRMRNRTSKIRRGDKETARSQEASATRRGNK